MTYAMPIPESGLPTLEWTDFLYRIGGNPDQGLARRRSALGALIEQHRPKIIICHRTTQTSALTAVPQISPATTTYVGRFFITPLFGNGRMSKNIAKAFVGTLRQSGRSHEMSEGSIQLRRKGKNVEAIHPKRARKSGLPRSREWISFNRCADCTLCPYVLCS